MFTDIVDGTLQTDMFTPIKLKNNKPETTESHTDPRERLGSSNVPEIG